MEGRVLRSRTGKIRGDEADQWLRYNDDDHYRRNKRKPRQLPERSEDWEFEDIPLEAGRAFGKIVYFVQPEHGGPVKIGRCMDGLFRERLADLQVGNPLRIVMRRVVRGGEILERDLHDHFAHLRTRDGGEWFNVDEELARVAHAVL
jgi:hypothetical protein